MTYNIITVYTYYIIYITCVTTSVCFRKCDGMKYYVCADGVTYTGRGTYCGVQTDVGTYACTCIVLLWRTRLKYIGLTTKTVDLHQSGIAHEHLV